MCRMGSTEEGGRAGRGVAGHPHPEVSGGRGSVLPRAVQPCRGRPGRASSPGAAGRRRQQGDAHGSPRAPGKLVFPLSPQRSRFACRVFILRGVPPFPYSRNWRALEEENGGEKGAVCPGALSGTPPGLPRHREAPRPPPVCGGRASPAPGWSPAHPSSSGSGGSLWEEDDGEERSNVQVHKHSSPRRPPPQL